MLRHMNIHIYHEQVYTKELVDTLNKFNNIWMNKMKETVKYSFIDVISISNNQNSQISAITSQQEEILNHFRNNYTSSENMISI